MNEINLNLINVIKKEVKERLSNPKGSHDWEHTERVFNMAMHLAEKENANKGVVAISALLHDIGRQMEDKSKGKLCHAKKGAEIAGKILRKYDLSADTTGRILHCISSHRFRGNNKPGSKEARILFDADKLDSIGAIGIGRAFLFAGEVGARLHNDDIDLSKTRAYSKEDTAYREYMVKLRFIRSIMHTGEGKKIAGKRHSYMEDFFKRLKNEINGTI